MCSRYLSFMFSVKSVWIWCIQTPLNLKFSKHVLMRVVGGEQSRGGFQIFVTFSSYLGYDNYIEKCHFSSILITATSSSSVEDTSP